MSPRPDRNEEWVAQRKAQGTPERRPQGTRLVVLEVQDVATEDSLREAIEAWRQNTGGHLRYVYSSRVGVDRWPS